MKASAQRPPQTEPRTAAPASARAGGVPVPEVDEDRDARMRRALAERAARPVQAKEAVETGYDDVIAAARAQGSRPPGGTGTGAPPAEARHDVVQSMERAFGMSFGGVSIRTD